MAREINEIELTEYMKMNQLLGFNYGEMPNPDEQENGADRPQIDMKAVLDDLKYYKKVPTEENYNRVANTLELNGFPEYEVKGVLDNFGLPDINKIRDKEEFGDSGNEQDGADEIPITGFGSGSTHKRYGPVEPDQLLADVEKLRDGVKNSDTVSLERLSNLEKELREIKAKEPQKTVKQIGKIASTIMGIYAMTANGDKLHDGITLTLALAGTATAVTTFVAGKAIIAVGKYAGGKLLKGAKGLAEKTAEKVERNRTLKAEKTIVAGKKVSEELVEIADSDLENSRIEDISEFSEIDRKNITDLRAGRFDEEALEEFEMDLVQRKEDSATNLRKNLVTMKNLKVYTELLHAGISEDKINKILEEYKVDKDGNIELPENTISLEEVENLGLKDTLISVSQMPKVKDMSDEQVLAISQRIGVSEDGKIVKNQDSNNRENNEQNSIEEDFLNGIVDSDLQTRGMEVLAGRLSQDTLEYSQSDDMLTEVESVHRFVLAHEFDEQMDIITEKIAQLDRLPDKTNKEKMQRDALRRLAEKKMSILENKGIIETIDRGRKTEKKVIDSAKDILIPDLAKARDRGSKTVDKLEEQKKDEEYLH